MDEFCRTERAFEGDIEVLFVGTEHKIILQDKDWKLEAVKSLEQQSSVRLREALVSISSFFVLIKRLDA